MHRLQDPSNNTMNLMYFLYLLQRVLADLCGHHQVVVQMHKKKSILGRSHFVADTKYDILVSSFLFQAVE